MEKIKCSNCKESIRYAELYKEIAETNRSRYEEMQYSNLQLFHAKVYSRHLYEGMLKIQQIMGKMESQIANFHYSQFGAFDIYNLNEVAVRPKIQLSKKWSLIRLDEIDFIEDPECGALYVFYKMDEIHYVGESSDITTRLKTHVHNIKKWSTPYIYYVKVRLSNRRKTDEKRLIKRLQPVGNIVGKHCDGSF
jgi:hypothetical protein